MKPFQGVDGRSCIEGSLVGLPRMGVSVVDGEVATAVQITCGVCAIIPRYSAGGCRTTDVAGTLLRPQRAPVLRFGQTSGPCENFLRWPSIWVRAMEGCAVPRFSRDSQGRARAREPHGNESGRADFSSSYFMEWRCVLGSSVWSTRTFAHWAAGNNSARCWRLYSEAPPIRARYAGMAPGYSDANRRGRGSGTGAVRENGYRTSG
jgi:hypothetical protein